MEKASTKKRLGRVLVKTVLKASTKKRLGRMLVKAVMQASTKKRLGRMLVKTVEQASILIVAWRRPARRRAKSAQRAPIPIRVKVWSRMMFARSVPLADTQTQERASHLSMRANLAQLEGILTQVQNRLAFQCANFVVSAAIQNALVKTPAPLVLHAQEGVTRQVAKGKGRRAHASPVLLASILIRANFKFLKMCVSLVVLEGRSAMC